MERMYDISGEQALNVGNSYIYTVTAADHAQYAGFFLTVADTVVIDDGVDNISIALDAHEEILVNRKTDTITGTKTGSIVFQF